MSKLGRAFWISYIAFYALTCAYAVQWVGNKIEHHAWMQDCMKGFEPFLYYFLDAESICEAGFTYAMEEG